jgi:REP element-mobilizing transposase RayT
MPRHPRIFAPGSVYHVYCRVTRGQFIFDDRTEAESFVTALSHVHATDNLVLLNWALLSNHYHLAVRTTKIPLWKSMMKLQRRVSRRYNKRHRFNGPLWQTRYRARIVLDRDYYQHLLAYITLNPVAAGLVNNPADWEWSGHRALIGLLDVDEPTIVDRYAALMEFDEEPGRALQGYLYQVRHLAEMRGEYEEVERLPWWRRVRTDYQTVHDTEIPDGAMLFNGEPAVPEIPAPPLDLLLSACCELAECSPKRLLSASRGEAEIVARRALVKVAVKDFGYKSLQLARLLRKNPCTVSRWLSSSPRSSAETALRNGIIDAVTVLQTQDES